MQINVTIITEVQTSADAALLIAEIANLPALKESHEISAIVATEFHRSKKKPTPPNPNKP